MAYPDDTEKLPKVEIRSMPAALWRRVRVVVATHGGTMSEFVVEAVREKLAREGAG